MTARSLLLGATFSVLLTLLAPISAHAKDNDTFAIGIAGTTPILWKDYKPLQDNVGTCLTDNRLETKTCKEVQGRVAHAMSDALLHAVLANVGNPANDKFCDEHSDELVRAKDTGAMAAYAILLVDERLKYGSGLYPSLQDTYVAKIVFDALVAQSPCRE